MYILIDVGGTNTRVAATENKETFNEPVIFDTPQDFEEWLLKTQEVVESFRLTKQITAIVMGVPGTLSPEHAFITKTPHLPLWSGLNIKERVSVAFSAETFVENDAELVGLGEAVYGSGKGHDIAVYVTISTGVGGVRIVNGKIDTNKIGFEIGHQIVNDGKEIEYYLAGSSHEKRFGIPSRENKDPELWKEVNYYTGVLAANTTMYWSPSIIIFGGPVMNDINLEEAVGHAKSFLTMYETLPLFVRSSLKSLGGIYGALAFSKQL